MKNSKFQWEFEKFSENTENPKYLISRPSLWIYISASNLLPHSAFLLSKTYLSKINFLQATDNSFGMEY